MNRAALPLVRDVWGRLNCLDYLDVVRVSLRKLDSSRQALHLAWQAPQHHLPPVGLSDQDLPHGLVPGVRAEPEPASRVFAIRTEVFRSPEACGGEALP